MTTVYYNQLALRALLKPHWFAKKGRLLPRPARPPPKKQPLFDKQGEVPGAGELAVKWVAEHDAPREEGPVQTYARYFAADKAGQGTQHE